MKRAGWYLVLILSMASLPFFAGPVQSQQSPNLGRIYYPQTTSRIGFSQEFNSYIWNGSVVTAPMRFGRWNVNLAERYRSSMLRVGPKNDKWKDDQQLLFNIGYQLTPALVLQSQLSSVVFLDQQSGFNNDIQTHANQLGLLFEPSPQISTRAAVGPKLDSRFDQNDSGIAYSFQASGYDLEWEDYYNSVNLLLSEDRYSSRRNSDFNVAYQMQRQFSQGTSDSLYVFTTNLRRDNYASFEGDIESYRENTRGIENRLRYGLGDFSYLDFATSIQFKNVEVQNWVQDRTERRRKRNDQLIVNDLAFVIKRKNYSSRTIISYWSQEQKYDLDVDQARVPFSRRTAFVTPNNSSNRFSLQSRTGWRISAADSLQALVAVSRFQYDTPDTNNFDDRDELRINTRVIFTHILNSQLKLVINASVNLYHMVYIFGERSADNNWNRIFQLRPSLEYKPTQNVRLKQTFEVLANYVDYDFEDVNAATRSFVFRKFALDDSLLWEISSNMSWLMDYRLQLEENGQLFWERWSERVLATRQNHWFHCYLRYHVEREFTVSPGYSFYLRREWRHKAGPGGADLKEATDPYLAHGPVLRFSYVPHQNLRLVLDATRLSVEPPGQQRYYNNDISLNLYWIF